MNLDAMTIEKINQVFKKEEKIKNVLLFGSRAKGTAKKGSDIDLAIIGDDLNFRDICKFGIKLDELDLPYKIDIVDYNAITNLELKEHIDRVCISLKSNSIQRLASES
ncbi:MAG: nucleotidyltransferase domain-containing protein [Sulfurimonas sp.]|nr:nucleotidyltransferase domain-containing protein [Sulfurimonas sp.]MDD5202735.1 nucleotidyltransferase domain-containing protein [Sulfurimonas sp.]